MTFTMGREGITPGPLLHLHFHRVTHVEKMMREEAFPVCAGEGQ